MNHDELDDLFTSAPEIEPSSAFAGKVIEAVRNEAATPPPIPFPWRLMMPGMAVGIGTWVALLAMTIRFPSPGPALSPVLASLLRSIFEMASALELQWIAAALALVLGSVIFAKRLVGVKV